MILETSFTDSIPTGWQWLNEPSTYTADDGLHITTDPNTDFWQRTHYGFRNDNGHGLLTAAPGDFQLTTAVRFEPENEYDQCGLLIRADEENWIKASAEYINPQVAELGSVVTNLGYSDWATVAISPTIKKMWYRISRRGPDFLLQNSYDGQEWLQMRITHLHAATRSLRIGIYACSPTNGRFTCTFEKLTIKKNSWQSPSH
jgi:hypothetical protein